MLQAKQRLGDFEIIRPLGRGGMGEVYEAQQLHPPRRVALKVLTPLLADSPEALDRFEREAAVPAQLDHPGIVRIISAGRTDEGVAYYTMQLVRGVSLSRLLRESASTPLPLTIVQQTTTDTGQPRPGVPADAHDAPADDGVLPALIQEYRRDRDAFAVRVGLQAARALAAAHRHGVLHRDVKPSNLMLDRHRQLYVVDFGLTKALAGDGMGTRAGAVCGTPWYMSPEQARGEPLDGRSDLFSLGVVLYELATGGLGPYPVSRADSDAVVRQVRCGQMTPLRSLAPDVPPELARIIERALQHRPSRRYQVAEEMASDLERLERDRSGSRQPAHRTRKHRKRAIWLAVLAGLVGVSLACLAAYWFRPRVPAETGPGTGDVTILPNDPLPSLPAALRDREIDHPVFLLKKNHEPIWQYPLFGDGQIALFPDKLALTSQPGYPRTLLALDNDPQHRGFEFTIELQQVRSKVPGTAGQQGIFFGWRTGSSPCDPFFMVRLEEPPINGPASVRGTAAVGLLAGPSAAGPWHAAPLLLDAALGEPTDWPGRLCLTAAYFDRGHGRRRDVAAWSNTLGPGNWKLSLHNPARERWRKITVRAAGDIVTVAAEGNVLEIDLRRLRREGAAGLDRLDYRGALGIWVENGFGFFRNPSVTALADRQ